MPSRLLGKPTHLDPDFGYLTYGDQSQRGNRINGLLGSGDFLAFFAGLRPVDELSQRLIYALIGLYVIEEIIPEKSVPRSCWNENAHTRCEPGDSDIVVRARSGVSGRLRHCIAIGEYRNRAYRVRTDLLDTWGGLDINDGYIQRTYICPHSKTRTNSTHGFSPRNLI